MKTTTIEQQWQQWKGISTIEKDSNHKHNKNNHKITTIAVELWNDDDAWCFNTQLLLRLNGQFYILITIK